MFHQDLQHLLDSLGILFYSPSKDEDIVQVDYYNLFCNEILEDIVYNCLEDSWAVGHSKEHYQGLEQFTVGTKDSLLLIFRFNLYIVEIPINIQLSKILGSIELSYKFRDQGQGLFVLHHHRVQGPIVLYQLERAILLLDQKHWSSYRQLEQVNLSSIQVLLQEYVQLLLLNQGKKVNLGRFGLKTQEELYYIISLIL